MSEKLIPCQMCGEMCKGIDELKEHMKACVKRDPNKIIVLKCDICNFFITTDPVEFLDHGLHCDGKRVRSSFQKKFDEEEQEKLRDKYNKIVPIKCSSDFLPLMK